MRMSGDIEAFLNQRPLPGRRTEAFIPPSDADVLGWRQTIEALLDGQYERAAALADPLGYDLIAFTDQGRAHLYYILSERTDAEGQPLRGLGTYIYNPEARRPLSIHAPHAGGDANTRPESIALFLDLDAVALLIAGTHRCANSEPSPCDGTTTTCTGSRAPYPISDVAHYTQNFFEPAHEEIVMHFLDVISVSVHGFRWRPGDPDVIVSNGTRADRLESLSIELAAEYNRLFHHLGVSLRAASCNQVDGPDRLCGTTNVQGRFVNGSLDICRQGVAHPSLPERFIHLEQSCALRQMSSCARPDAVSYQVAVEAFAALFPPRAESASMTPLRETRR